MVQDSSLEVAVRDLAFEGSISDSGFEDSAPTLGGVDVVGDVLDQFHALCEVFLDGARFRMDAWLGREFAAFERVRSGEPLPIIADMDGVTGDAFTGAYHGVVTGDGEVVNAPYGIANSYYVGAFNLDQAITDRLAGMLRIFAETHEPIQLTVVLQMTSLDGPALRERGMPAEMDDADMSRAFGPVTADDGRVLARHRFRPGMDEHVAVPAVPVVVLPVTGGDVAPPGAQHFILVVGDTASAATTGVDTQQEHG